MCRRSTQLVAMARSPRIQPRLLSQAPCSRSPISGSAKYCTDEGSICSKNAAAAGRSIAVETHVEPAGVLKRSAQRSRHSDDVRNFGSSADTVGNAVPRAHRRRRHTCLTAGVPVPICAGTATPRNVGKVRLRLVEHAVRRVERVDPLMRHWRRVARYARGIVGCRGLLPLWMCRQFRSLRRSASSTFRNGAVDVRQGLKGALLIAFRTLWMHLRVPEMLLGKRKLGTRVGFTLIVRLHLCRPQEQNGKTCRNAYPGTDHWRITRHNPSRYT